MVSGIELVTTSSSISEAVILSIAGPDKTGWVIYALTLLAPASFKAFAALQSVPAVSIISSGTIHSFPSTLPIIHYL